MNFNDYVASSNNSINENNLNAKKARSASHQIKKIIKPLLAFLKKNKNTYKKSPQPDYFKEDEEQYKDDSYGCNFNGDVSCYNEDESCSEVDDNLANELLEHEICQEIDTCEYSAAVPVYRNGHMDIIPVFRGQKYIPVHFAKTEAGTFFWTSMVGPDCDISPCGDKNATSQCQLPELQVASFRWAQA